MMCHKPRALPGHNRIYNHDPYLRICLMRHSSTSIRHRDCTRRAGSRWCSPVSRWLHWYRLLWNINSITVNELLLGMVRKKAGKMAGHKKHNKFSHLTISFNHTVFSKSTQVLSVSFCQCRVTLRCFKMTLSLSALIRSDANNEKYCLEVFALFGCISKTAVEKLAKNTVHKILHECDRYQPVQAV